MSLHLLLFPLLILLIACATTHEPDPSAIPRASPTSRPTQPPWPTSQPTKPLPTTRLVTAARSTNATPTLRKYWDLAACFDLFDRIVIAQASGLSDEMIAQSMRNAVGAVRRYGMSEVINHCYDNYSAAYERFLRGN